MKESRCDVITRSYASDPPVAPVDNWWLLAHRYFASLITATYIVNKKANPSRLFVLLEPNLDEDFFIQVTDVSKPSHLEVVPKFTHHTPEFTHVALEVNASGDVFTLVAGESGHTATVFTDDSAEFWWYTVLLGLAHCLTR